MNERQNVRQIVVSVDTEEEGLWGGKYLNRGNTTENLRGLDRFQAECERFGVAPTYLVDAPVLEDRDAVALMSGWQESGRCEVGAHCHPWCNPPLSDCEPTDRETFLCNLPIELQYEKLHWLTERIAETFGRRPTSYRAGRYGFDLGSASILRDLGYKVDSSVLPLHDYRPKAGPDFLFSDRAPSFQYDATQQLLEIPVTAGFTRARYRFRRRLWTRCRETPFKRFRIAGVLDRLGIARRVKLSPEGTQLSDLTSLVDSCVSDELTVLVVMLHSSSLVPGFSPYSRNANQLEEFYSRLNGMMQRAIQFHGFTPATLTGAAENCTKTLLNDSHHLSV